ncbi:MAG: hypothetical protein JXN59_14670 [Anaerolineae bacterium]|nr:hypothetical protein [Anaerolineae bacterium]
MLRMKSVILFVVLVALMSLPFGGVSAQGGELPPAFCGDLSDEDCAILEQSQTAMMEVSSSAVNMQFDMAFVGIEDPEDEFNMSILVDGAFAADSALLAQYKQAPTPEMMSEIMAEGMAVVAEMLRAVEGQADIQIVLPAELAAEAGIPLDSLNTTLVMVDGVVYANLESLIPAEAMEEGEMQMPAWMGIDLAGMYEMMGEMSVEEMGGDMDELQELFGSEELAAFYDYEAWGEFMTITRLEDAEVMGQPMAVFSMVLDYEAMFSSDAFQEAFGNYMQKMMELQGADAEEMPDNFMDVMTAMMSGMSMEITQWIGLEDYYMHHMDMSFAYVIDSEALAAVEPEAAEEMPENFSMSMQMVMDASAFNEPVEVVAPEGAQVINPMTFMEMAPESME